MRKKKVYSLFFYCYYRLYRVMSHENVDYIQIEVLKNNLNANFHKQNPFLVLKSKNVLSATSVLYETRLNASDTDIEISVYCVPSKSLIIKIHNFSFLLQPITVRYF